MIKLNGFAPTNEYGLVMLVSAYIDDLGIEIVQAGTRFPDATIKYNDKPIHIEFEYSSSNFYTHGHFIRCVGPTYKDVPVIVVCWKDNLTEESNTKKVPIIALNQKHWRDDLTWLLDRLTGAQQATAIEPLKPYDHFIEPHSLNDPTYMSDPVLRSKQAYQKSGVDPVIFDTVDNLDNPYKLYASQWTLPHLEAKDKADRCMARFLKSMTTNHKLLHNRLYEVKQLCRSNNYALFNMNELDRNHVYKRSTLSNDIMTLYYLWENGMDPKQIMI